MENRVRHVAPTSPEQYTDRAVDFVESQKYAARSCSILVKLVSRRWLMHETFAIHIFYPDGGPPESAEKKISELSPKWLGVCADLLAHYGPVMNHNMGGTLPHFDIRMGGPTVHLMAHKHLCYQLAISRGSGSEQDRAAVSQLEVLLEKAVEIAGKAVDRAAIAVLDEAPCTPSVLIFDMCERAVDEDQKHALAELGVHLAGAYYQYASETEGA